MIGIMDGKDNKISFKKKIKGKPLFRDSSISWTLLLNAKMEIIKIIKSKELVSSCLIMYFSINFIDII